ncbi:sensor histidine kinase [Nocardioides marmoriginsengisoli]|uniref:histidine kinase n=2 Tax=Nocardioides marmoriginsengisoli TaxID=661483 RepID=A0A3N0CLV8_9ACTN|nr:sensor histidine kinase [Nocardioides marmoriginsengisoli]
MRGILSDRLDGQVSDALRRATGPSMAVRSPDVPTPEETNRLLPGSLVVIMPTTQPSSAVGGIVQEDTDSLTDLSTSSTQRVVAVADRRTPHSIKVNGTTYRVLQDDDPRGYTFIVGLPTDDNDNTLASLISTFALLTLLGVGIAGVAGTWLVRRQLQPLHAVAEAAREVATQDLSTGETTISTRVPDELTDDETEVGQVGAALNTLLDHVDGALAARHRSEQQVRQFVADASHELRTPLSTIHGYAELSRRTPEDPEVLGTALNKVETEAGRMSALVEDLLLLARLDSGRPLVREEVDLTRLLLEAVADARVLAPDHHWRFGLPDEPVTVTGDAARLHQVVTNLLNNARNHTPAGTTVTVRVSTGDDEVRIEVHDDGPGLPEDIAYAAFERFTRGDSSRTRASGGAGLGLSLVSAIATAHGGTAEVVSQPGDTTFVVRLPR